MLRWIACLALTIPLFSCQRETQVEKANREGIMLVGNSAEPKSLDIHLVTGVIESKVLSALFEGLAANDVKSDDATPPGAAASWEHNADMTEWTFKLQPEGKWSDGVPVTAHDFVFAYNRLLHPDLAGPYAEMLYFISGAEDFNKGVTKDFSQVGVKALDDLTLQVHLRAPVPFLPALTRHYTWFPAPRHVILKHGKMEARDNPWFMYPNLVGNGPFKLKEWRFHDVIEVDRNPYYWDAENVGINGIRFRPIENPYTETRAFLAGQLHTTYQLPSDLIKSMERDHPKFFRQEPYVGTTFIRLNTTRPVLNDPRVREALALAIDRDLLCEHVTEGYQPAVSFTPDMGGFHPKPVLTFDPEKARRLLAEAGFPDGDKFPRFALLIARASARANAEAIQAMWKTHLNILIDIQNKDWGSYLVAQQSLDFDMAAAGWIGDYLDPTTFLGMWTKGNGYNNTGWSEASYDQLLRDAALQAEPAKRLEYLQQAETILMEGLPILPLTHYARNYLHHPSATNWYPLLLDNHPWKAIRLEK